MTEQHKRNPNIKCSICNKGIYRRPVEIERNNSKAYCGQKCYGLSQRKEIPCVICGKLILSGLNKKSCSRTCSNINRTGIKYKIGRLKDNAHCQKALKMRLLKLRQICERCDYNKFEILQVHHKDRDRKNSNLNNLELLCPNCHFEEHYLENSWLKNKY